MALIGCSQFSLEPADHMVCTDAKKSPRAHQRGALAAVGEGFAAADRVEADVVFLVLPISLLAHTSTR